MKKEKSKIKIKNFLISHCRFSFLNFSFYLLSAGVVIAVFFIVIFSTSSAVYAQADQSIWSKGVVQCGGQGQPLCNVCDAFKLIDNIIRLLWSGAALVGTVAFMYGGFLYWRGKPAEAKKVLTNVVIGIAIAFLAWIGIDTIIKLLVTQKFGSGAASLPKSVEGGVVKYGPWNQINCQAVSQAGQGGESGLAGPGKTAEEFLPFDQTQLDQTQSPEFVVVRGAEEAVARQLLEQKGIKVNKSACPVDKSYKEVVGGCTSVAGLPPGTINTLGEIVLDCKCGPIMLSGGTEIGHKEHGPGQPVVDLSMTQNPTALAEAIFKVIETAKKSGIENKYGIVKICTAMLDSKYSFNCTTLEAERHLHIVFKK